MKHFKKQSRLRLITAISLLPLAHLQAADLVIRVGDSVSIVTGGSCVLGTGIFPASQNPFALYTGLRDALDKAASYYAENPDALGFGVIKPDAVAAAQFLLKPEVIRAEEVPAGAAMTTKVDLIASVSFPVLVQRLKTVTGNGQTLRQMKNLLAWMDACQRRMDRLPNSRENCQAMVNALEAGQRVADGILAVKGDEKIRFLSSAISFEPRCAVAFHLRGLALSEGGRSAEALADLIQATRYDTTFAEAWSDQAVLLHAQRRTAEAIEACVRAVRHDTLNAGLYDTLGALFREAGRNENAVAAFTSGIRIDGGNPQRFIDRAAAFEALGRWADAIGDYTTAVRIDPKNGTAYYRRALAYGRIGGDHEKQLMFDLSQALVADPRNGAALFERGVIYKARKQYPEAAADFSAAMACGVQTTDIYYQRGLVFISLKRPQEAVHDFSMVIDRNPENANAWFYRGYSNINWGRWDTAVADLNRALKLKPDFAPAYYHRGVALRKLRRNDEAIADLQKYQQLAGNRDGLESQVVRMIEEMKYEFQLEPAGRR